MDDLGRKDGNRQTEIRRKRSTMPQKWMVYAWRVIQKMTNMSSFRSMIHWGRKTHQVGQSEQRSASAMKKPTSCGKPVINLP